MIWGFAITSLIILGFGIYLYLGGAKVWYLTTGIPVVIPVAIQHMLIPFGITLGIWTISFSLPTVEMRQISFVYLGGASFIITLILGIWIPRWLQPRWLQYLEYEYGTVMWHLLAEARKDAPNWSKRVETHEGLVAWAEEMRILLGYPPHPGKIEREAERQKKRDLYHQ